MADEPDAYAVLQVVPDAHPDVIRAAFRALARHYHPDGTAPDERRMRELNAAYERIGTTAARERYDAARRARVPVAPGRSSAGHGATGSAAAHGLPYDPWATGPLSARRARAQDDDGGTVIDFGRYAGWKIADLARLDADYLRWLSRHSAGIRFREAIAACLPGEGDVGRRGNALG
jgi:curved DNA-binding protein CbpA